MGVSSRLGGGSQLSKSPRWGRVVESRAEVEGFLFPVDREIAKWLMTRMGYRDHDSRVIFGMLCVKYCAVCTHRKIILIPIL